ncbi:uncharacterized protein ARMOST_22676 [Armillaria ostoyae]|uniref:Uncharacterized protein n=1 Tax=Armillaria ostoyae TaxID=47428 RepID=A0A284SDI2_ARMOS|nr:uncharacterized protein ARMOST_22676 [Armillaria ostoyae]
MSETSCKRWGFQLCSGLEEVHIGED